MLEFYSKDLNLKPYVKILEGEDLIPLIMDAEGRVLSMPPIINSDFSKIDLNTKNVFIEITATDLTKAQMGLKIICSNFSTYSETPCTFEAVKIVDGDNTFETPELPLYKNWTIKKSYIEVLAGIPLEDSVVIAGYKKMGLSVTVCT